MDIEIWRDGFIKVLDERYPKRSQLVQVLVELLGIEREAVYRRFRKEVAFSIQEIVTISSAWNISLDEITGISSDKIPFLMHPVNYIVPSDQELTFLQYVIKSIDQLKNFPDTEFMDICNKLPRQLLAGFKYLNQFHLFKWTYQYGNDQNSVTFSDINLSKAQVRLTADYYKAIKNVPNTNFIFDRDIFKNLASDINYFRSIQVISEKEKERIKNDLISLLDYLLEVANGACYPETKNKVNLYISNLNVNTNYSYTISNKAEICFVHVFDKFEIYTYNSDMLENFKTWMQLKKRSSIQISEVDKKSRIEFFTTQRQIIDAL